MMKTWFQSLSARERFMVSVGVGAGVLFLFWQIIMVPVSNWQASAGEQLRTSKLGYEQVLLAARMHGGTSIKINQVDTDLLTPLNRALASSASQSRLIVSSTDNARGQTVQITLAAADPALIYQWIETVRDKYGAVVIEARFSRARNNVALIKTDRLVFTRSHQSVVGGDTN